VGAVSRSIRYSEFVLSDRGIAEQGTHEELLRLNGAYAGLYNIQ